MKQTGLVISHALQARKRLGAKVEAVKHDYGRGGAGVFHKVGRTLARPFFGGCAKPGPAAAVPAATKNWYRSLFRQVSAPPPVRRR